MKMLVSFRKEESKLHGRSVTARMGHAPAPMKEVVAVAVTGYCYMFGQTLPAGETYYKVGQKNFRTESEALEFVSSEHAKDLAWFDSAEKVEIETGLSEGVESSGTTYAFDAWVNKFYILDLNGFEGAIDTIRGGYSIELYRRAFYAVFEHGRYSIKEMIELGWLVDDEKVINLTQHPATAEQVAAGVIEPAGPHLTDDEAKAYVGKLLTFNTAPSKAEMDKSARELAEICRFMGCKRAMIGGAPFFMSTLERVLKHHGIQPVYAFSVRDSIEQPDGNGGVKKVNIFRHTGWVEV